MVCGYSSPTWVNNRVLIWNSIPTANQQPARHRPRFNPTSPVRSLTTGSRSIQTIRRCRGSRFPVDVQRFSNGTDTNSNPNLSLLLQQHASVFRRFALPAGPTGCLSPMAATIACWSTRRFRRRPARVADLVIGADRRIDQSGLGCRRIHCALRCLWPGTARICT